MSAGYGQVELHTNLLSDTPNNIETRVQLQLQTAWFEAYVGGWRLEDRMLLSQLPTSLRSNLKFIKF